ncbi:MAG: flagellar hook-length control protein FliK [Treponema sp.]|nr:flagellar hook-length control protein FliK [Candidatus Treponema caballi]
MQAMNLHSAQQDILLNLLNVQPGKAQGMSKMPQGEMSFSSMLEHADKTYSTEGKNTQKPQDASPKTEAPSKKENEPREDMSVRNGKTDERAQKTESNDEVKSEDKAQPEEKDVSFDIEKADAEIDSFTVKTEDAVAVEDLVNAEDAAEKACLTMPDAEEITDAGNGGTATEKGLSSINTSADGLDASSLEDITTADKNALASHLETKPVTGTDALAETETETDASEKVEDKELSSDKKTKKKTELSDGKEAVQLVKADDAAAKVQQTAFDAGNASLAAVQAKADGSAQQENRIEIIDERTHAEPADVALNTTTTINADGTSAEMVMTLPVQAAGSDANGSLEAGYSKADFSLMLNNSLAASKDDLVKTGSIILQDNKKGSINLILRPEEFGNVKVKLELSDNQITGKIVVASKEAYDAFKQSLEDIRNAFVASGFDACGFDLAWAGAGDSNGSQGQNSADNGSQNQFGLQYYGTTYEDNIPDSVPEYYAENTHINLVA